MTDSTLPKTTGLCQSTLGHLWCSVYGEDALCWQNQGQQERLWTHHLTPLIPAATLSPRRQSASLSSPATGEWPKRKPLLIPKLRSSSWAGLGLW